MRLVGGCRHQERASSSSALLRVLRRVVVVALLAGLLGGAFAADLVIAVNSPTTTADPSIGNSVPHQRILTATYETLLGIELGGSDLVPVLATEWQANEDRTSFTFTIREGVTFHDGSMLDAEAVKRAFERTLAIGQGESYLIAAIDEMTVESTYRLRVDLSRPQPEFLYAMTRMFIMSPAAVSNEADGDDLARGWFATNTAGTGPFTVSEWVDGQRYVLDRHEAYWRGWDNPHVDRIIFRIVVEPATQRLLLESGEVHVAENVALSDLVTLQMNPNVQVLRYPSPRPFYVAFHTQRSPLDNVLVRRAIAYALDYAAAIDVGLSGYGSPMRGPVPEQFPGFNEELGVGVFDLDRARELLTEAGYPGGGFNLTFLHLEHWLFTRAVGLLLQDALDQIGIGLTIEGQPWATMTARMADREQAPDLVMYAQSTATPSALTILDPMYRSTSNHWSHFWYENPDVDALLDAAAAEVDDARRNEIYQQIQRIIYDDQPAIFTFSQDEVVTMRANVRGYQPQLTWSRMLNWYDIHIE